MSELFAQRLIGPLVSLEETGTFSPGAVRKFTGTGLITGTDSYYSYCHPNF